MPVGTGRLRRSGGTIRGVFAVNAKHVMPHDCTPEDAAADPPPLRPPEPDAAECCGEGCPRCVFDVHAEALERYRAALAAWQARHPQCTADTPP